jgi:sugar lactone lactonase YvrE
MKINLKAILSSLVGIACLLVGTVRSANAQSDLFVSVNAPGPGSTPGAVYRYTPSAVQSTFLPDVSKPRGLAFDSAGNMFLNTNAASGSPTTGTILRITPDGSTTTFATGFTNDFFLEGLAFDGDGNIFVNSSDLSGAMPITGTVFKVLSDGTVTTFGTVPGQAFGVAVDSAGNVFAASAGTDRTIYKFTPAAVRSVFAGPANFSGTQGPIGLTFDSSGNLFASAADAAGAGEILKFAPDGTKTVFATGLTNNPRGLAFDSSGNLFVAEVPATAPGDILKFTPADVMTTFATGIGRTQGNSGPEYLAFKSSCGCTGPQGPAGATGATGPAGPQGPAGVGFVSGGTLLMKQGSAAPAGFTKIGTTDFQYRDLTGKTQKVTLDVYEKN